MANGKNWTERPLTSRIPDFRDYAEAMAEKGKNRPKRPVSKEQQPSTARLMAMTDEEHKAFHASPIKAIKADSDAEAVFANTEHKTSCAIAEMARRQASKNTEGDAISSGAQGASEERKQAAREAFQYSPGKTADQLNVDDLCRMVVMHEPIPKPIIRRYEGPQRTWWTEHSYWAVSLVTGCIFVTIVGLILWLSRGTLDSQGKLHTTCLWGFCDD